MQRGYRRITSDEVSVAVLVGGIEVIDNTVCGCSSIRLSICVGLDLPGVSEPPSLLDARSPTPLSSMVRWLNAGWVRDATHVYTRDVDNLSISVLWYGGLYRAYRQNKFLNFDFRFFASCFCNQHPYPA